jgi:hypothetical protein
MKKILSIVVALFAISVVSLASVLSIPQEIIGIKIGETTQEDAHNILTEQKIEYDWKYDDNYYYKGEIKHEGIVWNEIKLTFANNKLIGCVLNKNCEDDCENIRLALIDTLKTKYDSIPSADSSLYAYNYIKDYSEQWSICDGNMLLAIYKRSSGFACLYMNNEYLIAKHISDSIADAKWRAERDSIRHVNDSLQQLQIVDIGRYKLYPTQNNWILLELDTQTGRVWQVQYSVDGPKYRFKTELIRWSLLEDSDLQVSGRFELYPTQNFYNFVLLDKISGKTWQVQWSTEYSNRGYMKIE